MSEEMRQDTVKATLYRLRLYLKNSGKKSYTVEEIMSLLDEFAVKTLSE
ncbi:MAG: hypothetical protein NC401_03565 [Ruminococcus sp.]|nr:hypothetical protein [Ruminococcus sp.]